MSTLHSLLSKNLKSHVHFDDFTRGLYATDASIYQMMPVGVVKPKTIEEAVTAIEIAKSEGVSILARGAGTSQCGQTVNTSLVIDCSKHLTKILDLSVEKREVTVQPGIVLDELNRQLKPHKLWFPVDISTASRATIGGMVANNSCGGRSLRYGTTKDNVISIEALLPNGNTRNFSKALQNDALEQTLFAIANREREEIATKYPQVQRRVGGYNIDSLLKDSVNLADILVGSEGTLSFTKQVTLKLSPVLGAKVFGVCHFGSFYKAMDAAQHLVKLKPIAVELVDATMIALSREIAMFKPTIERVVKGEPEALLIVEFAEETEAQNLVKLSELEDMMAALGFAFDKPKQNWGGVNRVIEPAWQAALTEMRSSGLNIMMSMKEAGKPVSFIEDCAVPLENLAEYTSNLTEIFHKHGTNGTWYAHASEGCLHVRPVLNMKLQEDVTKMRAIAEEAFAEVRRFKGSHSGEHGDGIVRSEFHEAMFGARIYNAFKEVKAAFDPLNLFNPGKIVDAPKMDDRTLFRYAPSYTPLELKPVLDWSDYPSHETEGLLGAVEMCNNNGTCRKLEGGAMCPSYRVTHDEKDVTRGRANTLRLALTGQIGKDALTSSEMQESLKLCVSCKSCKRECPTGVDMARMKIEVTAKRVAVKGLTAFEWLVAYLPAYGNLAAKFAPLLNLRNKSKALAWLGEKLVGFAASRPMPAFRRDIFAEQGFKGEAVKGEVVLFVDTFNRLFEREVLDASIRVLNAAGFRVNFLDNAKPLCCGRTYLTSGLVDKAKAEASRLLTALKPYVEKNIPIIGLEPSCLLGLKDEIPALMRKDFDKEFLAKLQQNLFLFEEFIVKQEVALQPLAEKALLHGHCHQKAFGAMGAVEKALRMIPALDVKVIESSCCGMAGSFGYHKDTVETSLAMANLSLIPAVNAEKQAIIVADGTSCRHQIDDLAGRKALHVAEIMEKALDKAALKS